MRLLAGAEIGGAPTALATDAVLGTRNGGRLARRNARRLPPARSASPRPSRPRRLKATLRPYQDVGVRWLGFLAELGLGACLADDMGLGKTVQVLALILTLSRSDGRSAPEPPRRARLRFSPTGRRRRRASRRRLRVFVAHPVVRARRPPQGTFCRGASRDRSRRHELRRGAAARLDRQDALAARGARRGAGDQEPRREADPRRQGALRRQPRSR